VVKIDKLEICSFVPLFYFLFNYTWNNLIMITICKLDNIHQKTEASSVLPFLYHSLYAVTLESFPVHN
jgi:hypothetical protein